MSNLLCTTMKHIQKQYKTEYHRQYSFIECAGKKELEMFKLITFLNKKDRDKVHQFAYELYKNRRKRC